ncbi:MAG: FAD synthetase family protein [Actinobacteria bacterium]|nr:FAD synthetase family protein [Actinomycetota bacterium]
MTEVVASDPGELASGRRRAVAIGNFDGVHRGHREVLDSIVRLPLRSTVVTFDPHPRVFFGQEVGELTSLARRLELLAETGVDEALVLRFDGDMAALGPEEWVRRYLHTIGAERVVVGEGFRFGRDRAGDVDLMRRLGLDVRPVPLVSEVSSSRVRELIRDGDLRSASDMLGRRHELDVTVVRADHGALGAKRVLLRPETERAVLPRAGRFSGMLGAIPAKVRRLKERLEMVAEVPEWTSQAGDRTRLVLERTLISG